MSQDILIKGSSVLVVDDNVKNLQIIGGILQNEGFKVEFALDGIDGSIISLDQGSDKIQFSGAFNPLILIHDDQIIEIKADRFPIGYSEVWHDFTLHEIKIEKNDVLYMFSDGLVDQFGGPLKRNSCLKN